MRTTRLAAKLTLVRLSAAHRLRQVYRSGDRGSETSEKVMWIALLVTLVLAVYAIMQSKILDKVSSITL
ncbi:hypothetical protein ACFFMR_29355 [Micromonospora andamanensis]|uniref:DUF2970 domain-containing protein n=1 Tax=Micromonospora andamanensis TaxID=1287068 RepID=A0ABQ4HRY6_9ACTN|nr:hypothetical protein [Micromonospora andamanensis]GIJ08401.1 hypothetical protein Van01_16150 [Micromonospora andamanensis]